MFLKGDKSPELRVRHCTLVPALPFTRIFFFLNLEHVSLSGLGFLNHKMDIIESALSTSQSYWENHLRMCLRALCQTLAMRGSCCYDYFIDLFHLKLKMLTEHPHYVYDAGLGAFSQILTFWRKRRWHVRILLKARPAWAERSPKPHMGKHILASLLIALDPLLGKE